MYGPNWSDEELKVKRILLDVVRLGTTYNLDKYMLNPLNVHITVEEVLASVGREMLIRMEQKVASQALDTITFHKPASWWQHFKHEKFPNWLKKKFPVKFIYEEYKVSALYPKLAIPDGQHVIQVHKME